MKQRYLRAVDYLNSHSWVGVSFLFAFGLAYSFRALLAPFWGDHDAWSNLLPIIHYRDSILNQHILPTYTTLWYGGWRQWANPLWSFLYLPATLVWLFLPLDWGTRVVLFSHLIFIALVGRKLASLFVNTELQKVSAAILLTAPALPAFIPGHFEKIMSWGWVLLGLYFLLASELKPQVRGLGGGICLGVIALTGSNYYALYAGILFLALLVGYRNFRMFGYFFIGSLIGLAHFPSVWHMIGESRANPESSIAIYQVDLFRLISSLSGFEVNADAWEFAAPVGLPIIGLFIVIVMEKIRGAKSQKGHGVLTSTEKALAASMIVFALLASGAAYQVASPLYTFRVPVRAIVFVALCIILFTLIQTSQPAWLDKFGIRTRTLVLLVSAIQVGVLSLANQPAGAKHGPYDVEAQQLASILKEDGAKSVWLSLKGQDHEEMYIAVVLNQNQISLPNVYYGDMGQQVKIRGEYCGFSFDHVVASSPEEDYVRLRPDMEWSEKGSSIPLDRLVFVQQVRIDDNDFNVYRVNCRR